MSFNETLMQNANQSNKMMTRYKNGDAPAPVIPLPPVQSSFSLDDYTISGSLSTLPTASNASGAYYNPDNNRVGITKNNSAEIDEYDADDLSTIVRTFGLNGLNGYDIEGLVWMGNNEFAASDETGGGYVIHIYDYPTSGTGPIAPKQSLTLSAPGADNNSGLEGLCYDPVNEVFYGVGEGQQGATARRFFKVERPTNTATDYDYNDIELVITEPFNAETALPETGATFDMSGITYHAESDTVIISSHMASKLVQLDPNGDGTILSELNLPSGQQWEGIVLVENNNLLAISEPNEYQRYSYKYGVAPVITQPVNASINLGDTFSYTPSLSAGQDVLWYKEYGPDAMTVDPETGEISWNSTGFPRGQGLLIGLGCSNPAGQDIKWFVLHVANGAGALKVLGVDTTSPYIRIAAQELNSGDTLVVPAGTYPASVTADESYENAYGINQAGHPAGTASQLTTIIAADPANTIITAEAHDAIPRQKKVLELSGHGQYTKFCGFECTGTLRQAIINNDPSIVLELMGGTDSGYNIAPTTFDEADGAYGSVSAIYQAAANTVAENCYAFGQFRYGIQFGNVVDGTLCSRSIVRPDEYHGDQPRGGIAQYSTRNSGLFNSFVIDADHEHLSPFYSNFAGAFAYPATGNEAYPENLQANGACAINVDMLWSQMDATSVDVATLDNIAGYDMTSSYTPQTGAQSALLISSNDAVEIDNASFGKIASYDNLTLGSNLGAFRAGSATNDMSISNSILDDIGWNGSDTINVGPMFEGAGGSTLTSLNNNIFNFKGVVAGDNSYTVTGTIITDPHLNGWDYPTRVESGSPLDLAGSGANLENFKNPSHVMQGDAGWDTETSVFAWPHPAEQLIAAKAKSYSKTGLPVRNSTAGQNPTDFTGSISGDRGFAATGESFSEYVWGQFGRTVPPLRVAAKATASGEVTFRVGKYRSSRGDTIEKFNIYETGNLVNPIAAFSGLKHVLTGVSAGSKSYVIRAVDSSKVSAWGANETGESGNSRTMGVLVS
jgi:uncharacterized protein YjiK